MPATSGVNAAQKVRMFALRKNAPTPYPQPFVQNSTATQQRLALEPEICACDLGEAFAVSHPTVSEHLRVLREAGLVTTRRRGTTICYSAVPEALSELATVVAALHPRETAEAA